LPYLQIGSRRFCDLAIWYQVPFGTEQSAVTAFISKPVDLVPFADSFMFYKQRSLLPFTGLAGHFGVVPLSDRRYDFSRGARRKRCPFSRLTTSTKTKHIILNEKQ